MLITNIKIIREICALEVCFGMLIKPEYRGVYYSIEFEYHLLDLGG